MPFPIPDDRLLAMLRDDVPYGDATTLGLGIGSMPGRAVFRVRGTVTACCTEDAERLMILAGCTARRLADSGDRLEAGADLLVAEGQAAALHRGLKVAQTLMEITSGIATRARRLLDAARAARPGIAVACTRKHLPGAKDVMLKAIMAGGCVPHRLGLSDSVLVFPQHRAFLAGQPAEDWVGALRLAQPERKIAAEAESIEDALALAWAGVDSLQLDKLPPAAVREVVDAVSALPFPPLVAVAGGVTEANAGEYAAAGARLLVTSAPYAAPPADIGVAVQSMDDTGTPQ
ncbi:ModD protein [Rhodovarius crocodyli]|uniref:Putative pyrophosphorylase ModD n=1 Tax=Rhodovarius crocodyli TaxID=1979269 RepID=A0A437LXP8_9PROT|nr:ModD protein [Rhodovarius crocodyli]RVT90093.1 ModD protein [Rhodovarius crocodyli]